MPGKSPHEQLTELIPKLRDIPSNAIAHELVYLKPGVMNDRNAFHQLNIDNGLKRRIAQETALRLVSKIEGILEQGDGLLEIGTTDLPRDMVGYIDISHFDFSGDDGSPDQDNNLYDLLSEFPGASHRQLLGNDLKTYASRITLTATNISLGVPDDPSPLISICRQGGSTFMRRGKIWMCGINEGALTEVNDVFELQNDTDFFIWDGTIWVINERSFENTLGFEELSRKRAVSALSKITTNLGLEDQDTLIDAINKGKRSLRMASQLHTKKYLDDLNNHDFMAYCDSQNLSGWSINTKGNIQFENHSSKTITSFLNALSQNYFPGGLDGGNYQATGKIKLS